MLSPSEVVLILEAEVLEVLTVVSSSSNDALCLGVLVTVGVVRLSLSEVANFSIGFSGGVVSC